MAAVGDRPATLPVAIVDSATQSLTAGEMPAGAAGSARTVSRVLVPAAEGGGGESGAPVSAVAAAAAAAAAPKLDTSEAGKEAHDNAPSLIACIIDPLQTFWHDTVWAKVIQPVIDFATEWFGRAKDKANDAIVYVKSYFVSTPPGPTAAPKTSAEVEGSTLTPADDAESELPDFVESEQQLFEDIKKIKGTGVSTLFHTRTLGQREGSSLKTLITWSASRVCGEKPFESEEALTTWLETQNGEEAHQSFMRFYKRNKTMITDILKHAYSVGSDVVDDGHDGEEFIKQMKNDGAFFGRHLHALREGLATYLNEKATKL